MTTLERITLIAAVRRIPCELSIATNGKTGCAWAECKECARCLLLHALEGDESFDFIQRQIVEAKPHNGGYVLRPELRIGHQSAER